MLKASQLVQDDLVVQHIEHYCNSVLHRVSAVSVQPLQNVLNAAAIWNQIA